MLYTVEIYFMMFIIYAILGWLMECTVSLIYKHKFVNRGFLIGPYCPIYGVGVVGLTLLLGNFQGNILVLFFLSILICGTLEYFTSYIMEKLFNARWWDYSQKKININGRVCLDTLLPFGFLGVGILKLLNPFIIDKLHLIPDNTLMYICIIIALIYLTDTIVSLRIISNFKNMNKEAKDNTEEISNKVRETAEATIAKLTTQKEILTRRMRIRRYSLLKNIKYTRKNYTTKIDKIKNEGLTLVGTFKSRIQVIDDNIKRAKKEMSEKVKAVKDNQLKLANDIKEKFIMKSKLNKRLISAFPNVQQKDYTRKKKHDKF